jgi:hypothetical protein
MKRNTKNMLAPAAIAIASTLGALCLAADPPNSSAVPSIGGTPATNSARETGKKPTLKVEKDGWPSGHGTPEGAACDLARAFIKRDTKLFKETCIAPFGGREGRKPYEEFLKIKEASIAAEALKTEPSPGGPKSIGKLFAARHLSKNGPASFAYAAWNFQDVMFVDVGVFLQNGNHLLNRALVIKNGGKWYVHPFPEDAGLIADGLNDEAKSTQDFSEAYDIQK